MLFPVLIIIYFNYNFMYSTLIIFAEAESIAENNDKDFESREKSKNKKGVVNDLFSSDDDHTKENFTGNFFLFSNETYIV